MLSTKSLLLSESIQSSQTKEVCFDWEGHWALLILCVLFSQFSNTPASIHKQLASLLLPEFGLKFCQYVHSQVLSGIRLALPKPYHR
jgi:hypothetical protein